MLYDDNQARILQVKFVHIVSLKDNAKATEYFVKVISWEIAL